MELLFLIAMMLQSAKKAQTELSPKSEPRLLWGKSDNSAGRSPACENLPNRQGTPESETVVTMDSGAARRIVTKNYQEFLQRLRGCVPLEKP
jgi:hypothetical protein